MKQALHYHQQGDLESAKKLYEAILSKDKGNVDVLHLLSILLAQQGNYEAALELNQRALTLNPKSELLLSSAGNIFYKLGRHEEAEQRLIESLRLNPESCVTNNNLANLYYKLGKTDLAIHYYEEAIRIKPDYADAHYNLGLAHARQNNIAEAIKNFQSVVELESEHYEAHYQLAKYYYQQEWFEKAVAHYEAFLKVNTGEFTVLQNLGACYLRLNNLDAALRYYLQALEKGSDFDIYYNIGVIYLTQNRYSEALSYFVEALKMNSNDFALHNNLGAVYLKLGDAAKAICHYRAALDLQPDNQEVAYILSALECAGLTKAGIDAAPKEYLQNLFDQYAPRYDVHLTKYLQYKVPELIYQAVVNAIPDLSHASPVIMDLGCGTGLCGEKFMAIAGKLIGVDLSAGMLSIAKEKDIYDELIESDVAEALARCSHGIDILIAADTLVYIGDLMTLFEKAAFALKAGGVFAFSCEKTSHYPYVLQSTARYAHAESYIMELAEKYGFTLLNCLSITLRLQKDVPVPGNLYVLKH